jgi:hypothetical protein
MQRWVAVLLLLLCCQWLCVGTSNFITCPKVSVEPNRSGANGRSTKVHRSCERFHVGLEHYSKVFHSEFDALLSEMPPNLWHKKLPGPSRHMHGLLFRRRCPRLSWPFHPSIPEVPLRVSSDLASRCALAGWDLGWSRSFLSLAKFSRWGMLYECCANLASVSPRTRLVMIEASPVDTTIAVMAGCRLQFCNQINYALIRLKLQSLPWCVPQSSQPQSVAFEAYHPAGVIS